MTTTTGSLELTPGLWTQDPAHSSVGFSIRHLGISKIRGRFTTFDVQVRVGEPIEASTVTARIGTASIDTANADRDTHVRSADILGVANRPELVFRSTSFTADGESWTLAGELTLGEATAPVTLAVEFGGIEPFPGGPRHAGFTAIGELRRSALGIAPDVPSTFLGDALRIELDLQLLEPVTETV
jgi:polyisoprenoid-binding protein YceI